LYGTVVYDRPAIDDCKRSMIGYNMDIRDATNKARERSTWRLLVRASLSANALPRRTLEYVTMHYNYKVLVMLVPRLRKWSRYCFILNAASGCRP